MSIRDLIRARMSRSGMSRGPSGPSRRPSSGRDVDMHVRNQRLSGPSAAGRREVPGLPGLYFADDYGEAMQTAARSSNQFHSGNLDDMLRHPAVGFSKSQAGIGESSSRPLIDSTNARLAEKGITRDSTGQWRLGQNQERPNVMTGAGLSQTMKSPLSQQVTPPKLSQGANANGGNVTMGDIPGNTKLNIDVSGGTQVANGKTTQGTPGQQSVGRIGGTPPAPVTPTRSAIGGGIRDTINAALEASRVAQQAPAQQAPAQASPPPTPLGHYPATGTGANLDPGNPSPTIPPTQPQGPYDKVPTQAPPPTAGAGMDPTGPLRNQGTANPLPLIQGGEPLMPTSEITNAKAWQNPQAQGVVAPAPTAGTAAPSGPIQAPLSMPNATGGSWDAVAPYEAEIQAAVAKYPEVDPAMVRAAIMMESQGRPRWNEQGSSSYGVLQIQAPYHRESAAAMGLTLNVDGGTTADDIMYWTALMAGKVPGNVPPGNTPLERYANNYGTGDAYFQDVQAMMDEQHAMAPPPLQGQTAQPMQPPAGGFDPRLSGAMRGDVRGAEAGLPVVQGGQQMPGSAATGQRPSQQGMMVGEDAVQQTTQQPASLPLAGNSAPQPGVFGGNSASKLGPQSIPITPGVTPGTSPANITPANPNGLAATSSGDSPISPANPQPKIPQATGQLELVGNADGMGIAATTASDDSWQKTAFGPNTTTSTYYKQPVTWSCGTCGGGCLYNYQCPEAGNGYFGADASTHAAMDILCNGGAGEDCRGSAVNTPVAGTVLCSGGQGEGNYVGCNFATSPEVVDNGGIGQISVNSGTDVNGNMLVMEYWHMQTSNVQPGQQVNPGDLLGGMGSMGGMVHTHLEAQGWCPECNNGQGAMVTLDPTLVANGYYSTHSPSEGYATPATLGPVQTSQPQGYMSEQSYQNMQSGSAAPAPAAAPAAAPASSGYAPGEPGSYQSQPAPAPAMPAPSSYDTGVQTQNTGQVVVDQATGQQFEIMADGSARLIYDPSW